MTSRKHETFHHREGPCRALSPSSAASSSSPRRRFSGPLRHERQAAALYNRASVGVGHPAPNRRCTPMVYLRAYRQRRLCRPRP
ncbi:MAG: hypothetical protein ACLT98_07000 [Eggerthellaceae bacterium]